MTQSFKTLEAVLIILLTNEYGKNNARYIAQKFAENTTENFRKFCEVNENLICGAFIWSESPQGHDFWNGVEKTYLEQLKYSILEQL